jgi:hypothetical protein
MKLIESKTLGTAQASIEFTSIPQTYTDLVLMCSLRASEDPGGIANQSYIRFNGTTTNYSERMLRGFNGSVSSNTNASTGFRWNYVNASPSTANTFTNNQIYIPNYAGSTNKSVSIESVVENNSSDNMMNIWAGLWSNTAAITTITFLPDANWVAGSTISLYGILKGTDGIVTTSP